MRRLNCIKLRIYFHNQPTSLLVCTMSEKVSSSHTHGHMMIQAAENICHFHLKTEQLLIKTVAVLFDQLVLTSSCSSSLLISALASLRCSNSSCGKKKKTCTAPVIEYKKYTDSTLICVAIITHFNEVIRHKLINGVHKTVAIIENECCRNL